MKPITIYNKKIPLQIIKSVISLIKSKKELANLDDKFCKQRIVCYLKKNKKALQKISTAKDFKKIEKSKQLRDIVKSIRAEARRYYGVYQEEPIENVRQCVDELCDEIKSNKPLTSLKTKKIIDLHKKVLNCHLSSKERLPFYKLFYKKIFQITKKPKSILDLACGLNPFSVVFMDLANKKIKKLKYFASELNQKDVNIINKYFEAVKEVLNIDGNAFRCDLVNQYQKINKNIKEIKETIDICFVLKTFDLIPSKIVEQIVKTINTKWFVVSFPTKKISQKQMRFKRRAGFQKMLRRLDIDYQILEFENEIVYVFRPLPL